MITQVIALAVLTTSALGVVTTALTDDTPLETFKINLDDPPRTRFVAPTARFAAGIKTTLDYYE